MSSFVLPNFPGLMFPIGRSTTYKTLTDLSLAKQSANLALQQYPVHSYDLKYELLRDNVSPSEIKAIVGLFNYCRGRFDSFLYSDPVFNTVTAEQFGVGNGVTKDFQILATFKIAGGVGAPDIIQNFNGTPSFFDNGSPAGTATLGPTGILSFSSPPAGGHILTWTGGFYQRCHFLDDMLETQQFMNKLWQIDSLKFESILLA